ncbi:uncharacterized protein V1518DRAFT_402859 [Limtongia smithiae]|uniref:uncharacterized protein n=1 Tax=Limtongia smithiae TaxID=1125753 RepID=UPI0034CE8E18
MSDDPGRDYSSCAQQYQQQQQQQQAQQQAQQQSHPQWTEQQQQRQALYSVSASPQPPDTAMLLSPADQSMASYSAAQPRQPQQIVPPPRQSYHYPYPVQQQLDPSLSSSAVVAGPAQPSSIARPPPPLPPLPLPPPSRVQPGPQAYAGPAVSSYLGGTFPSSQLVLPPLGSLPSNPYDLPPDSQRRPSLPPLSSFSSTSPIVARSSISSSSSGGSPSPISGAGTAQSSGSATNFLFRSQSHPQSSPLAPIYSGLPARHDSLSEVLKQQQLQRRASMPLSAAQSPTLPPPPVPPFPAERPQSPFQQNTAYGNLPVYSYTTSAQQQYSVNPTMGQIPIMSASLQQQPPVFAIFRGSSTGQESQVDTSLAPPTSATSANRAGGKVHVIAACSNCKKAHLACDASFWNTHVAMSPVFSD